MPQRLGLTVSVCREKMPTRSRQSNARAAAQSEEAEATYNIPGIAYNEALTWRAGKAISVADLFSRLQKLSNELREVEQNAVEVKDIAPLAQDLVHPNLLGHKDKGIRAWTVACVVDILNICAPNAPYRPNQLRDIFTVIVNTILPALADPSNAYNAQHQYILDQLVDAQSILLITDIQDSDELVTQLFTNAFDVVSGSGKSGSGVELAQSVVFQISMMLNIVVDEANLPQDVIDTIIAQFLRVDPRSHEQPHAGKKKNDAKDKSQSTLLLKNYPPAYNLAKSVCTACSEKMAASISQYFNTIITNAGDLADDEEDKPKHHRRAVSVDSDDDTHNKDAFNDLRKAHRLVKELWRACPDVLMNVVPQIELELSADSRAIRRLAVETLGDMIAGVGLAGLPDLPALDPAAFPQPTIDNADIVVLSTNPLLQPASPKPFAQVHLSAYQAFLGRAIDKDISVRSSFTKAISRILLTRAGGSGLRETELKALTSAYVKILHDLDEKVRLTALESLDNFPYHTVIDVLGSDGGLSQPSSLFSIIAERVTDKKPQVREQAMHLLGTFWGVASRDIFNRNERVLAILGQCPSKIFSAMYVKDAQTTATISEVLFERLLPLSYPPIKGKIVVSETQGDGDVAQESVDPDSLRVRRMLVLVHDLDAKSKTVFFGLQKRQSEMSKAIGRFLRLCEDFNGGTIEAEDDEKKLEDQLNKFIETLSKQFPEPAKVAADLWRFARAHDRRAYQLIKFAIGAEHDYKTMSKAIRELRKRLQDGGLSSVRETLDVILNVTALVAYNRSHIPAIMEHARSPEDPFVDTAQELLREISEKVPEVMKTHIKVLCEELEQQAPSQKESELPSAADSLKACAAFARKYPEEIPRERHFYTSMLAYVQHSISPKAAKHAATIVLSASDKKDMYAKEMLTKAIKGIETGATNKLAHLAAIAQVSLLSSSAANAQEKGILKIAQNVMGETEVKVAEWNQTVWSDDVDQETAAKQLALKIYVNRCRGQSTKDNREKAEELAKSAIEKVMEVLITDGDISKNDEVPSTQRNHLRLAAAKLLLKLCRHKPQFEELVTPTMFHTVAWILVSPPYGVRGGLVRQLKKYLAQGRLNSRWLTLLFLLPFEPDDDLRLSAMAWLRSRSEAFTRQQQQARNFGDKKATLNVMELTFARFLSLLAHHPDFPIKGEEHFEAELLDFAKYVVFYLLCIATEENISLIFHVAQRVKQAADAVSNNADMDERLYVLSDLAQATIRNYADQMPGSAKGVNLIQAYPGKAPLPSSLFKSINGHARAQEIAGKSYLPEDVALGLQALVKRMIKIQKDGGKSKQKAATSDKKRKSSVSIDLDDDEPESTKKSAKKSKKERSTSLPIRKTPAKSASSKKRKSEAALSVEQPSRKSARTSTTKKVKYEESDDDEDDVEDTENVISYKPAPMDKYKHKSKQTRDDTPVIEEEDEGEEIQVQQSSPIHRRTKATKEADLDGDEDIIEPAEPQDIEVAADEDDQDVVEPDDPQDIEMTNGADEGHTNGVDAHEDEAEEDEDEEEEAAASSPAAKRNGRASRRKTNTTHTPASAKKAKAKEKEKDPPKTKESTSKSKASSTKKAVKGKDVAPISSPAPAEPARRSSRRHKA